MKIRTGFVSNSSSSSFVAVIDKTTHDKTMRKMKNHKYYYILDQIFADVTIKKIGVKSVIVLDGRNVDGYRRIGNLSSEDDFYEDNGLEWYENWDNMVDKVYNEYLSEIPESFRFVVFQNY